MYMCISHVYMYMYMYMCVVHIVHIRRLLTRVIYVHVQFPGGTGGRESG